jgi:hypothetical protein
MINEMEDHLECPMFCEGIDAFMCKYIYIMKDSRLLTFSRQKLSLSFENSSSNDYLTNSKAKKWLQMPMVSLSLTTS